MGYQVKTEAPCVDCGRPTTGRQNKSRAPLCIECGIGRAIANAHEQAKRGGKNLRRDIRTMKQRAKS